MSLKVPLFVIVLISFLSIGALSIEYLPWWSTKDGKKSIEQVLNRSSQDIETYAKSVIIANNQGDSHTATLAVQRLNSEVAKYHNLTTSRTAALLAIFKMILIVIFIFGAWIHWSKHKNFVSKNIG